MSLVFWTLVFVFLCNTLIISFTFCESVFLEVNHDSDESNNQRQMEASGEERNETGAGNDTSWNSHSDQDWSVHHTRWSDCKDYFLRYLKCLEPTDCWWWWKKILTWAFETSCLSDKHPVCTRLTVLFFCVFRWFRKLNVQCSKVIIVL